MTVFVLLALVVLIAGVVTTMAFVQEMDLVLGLSIGVTITVLYATLAFPIGIALSAATTGTLPNYSSGSRDGYLTKISQEGAIWKTWECEMQVGTGEQAALQNLFEFSIRDGAVVDLAHDLQSQRVRVTYRRWFVQPWRYGATDYEAVRIEPLKRALEAEK